MIKPLCVISCPIDTYSGYGARSRDFIKALYESKKDEWDIKVLPQRWGNCPWGFINDHQETMGWMNTLLIYQLNQQPDYWCQITVPNEFQPIGKLYNLGVTAGIETTICDPSWIQGVNKMNLTLVSSEHAKQVFENSKFDQKDNNTGHIIAHIKLEKPVEVLFEGIDTSKYFYIDDNNIKGSDLVDSLDEIKENFCFLFVGHWMNGDIGEDRKNVGLTIKTFLETFKNKTNPPALILKTARGTNSIMDRDDILNKIDSIRKTVIAKTLPNVYLLHGEFGDNDMNDLYNHDKIKVMLGLVKGEGYFRPLSEFFMSKKPALVSYWSGHLDFCNDEFCNFVPGELKEIHPSAQAQNMLIQGSQWFYPNMDFAAKKMLDMWQNYKNYEVNAKRQSRYVFENFTYDKMKEKLNETLDKFPKHVALKLPQLKKIELPALKKM